MSAYEVADSVRQEQPVRRVQQVTMWKARNGTIHRTEADAECADKVADVMAVLDKMGQTGPGVAHRLAHILLDHFTMERKA